MSLASWFRKLLSPRSAPLKAELGRNDLCWCGSGKKYKKCHLAKDQKDRFEAAHALFTRLEDAEDDRAAEGDWAPGQPPFVGWE